MLNDEFCEIEAARKARRENLWMDVGGFHELVSLGDGRHGAFQNRGFLANHFRPANVLAGGDAMFIFARLERAVNSPEFFRSFVTSELGGLIDYAGGVTVLLWFSCFLDLIAPSLHLGSSQL